MIDTTLTAAAADASMAAAILCAGILAASGWHKASSPVAAATAVEDMLGASGAVARALAWLAASIELAGAAALLAPPLRSVGACMALALWSLYAAAIAFALVSGRGGRDCGCTLGRRPLPLGRFQLIRLGVLLPLAGLAFLAPGGWPGPSALFAGAILFLAYMTAEELAANGVRRSIT